MQRWLLHPDRGVDVWNLDSVPTTHPSAVLRCWQLEGGTVEGSEPLLAEERGLLLCQPFTLPRRIAIMMLLLLVTSSHCGNATAPGEPLAAPGADEVFRPPRRTVAL